MAVVTSEKIVMAVTSGLMSGQSTICCLSLLVFWIIDLLSTPLSTLFINFSGDMNLWQCLCADRRFLDGRANPFTDINEATDSVAAAAGREE